MKNRILQIFFLVILANFLFGFLSPIGGQPQVGDFSANNPDSYQCFVDGEILDALNIRGENGYFLCPCNDGSTPNSVGRCPGGPCTERDRDNDGDLDPPLPGDPGCDAPQASIKPPTLQQLEIWFVRIIYVIWTLIATFSVFYLVVLGYRYMISRGDVTKITEIRQKIVYYILGVVVVFLAIPILTTVFRILGVNESVQCYNVNLDEIGFQFFFADLCTIRDYDYYCERGLGGASDLVCPNAGFRYPCPKDDPLDDTLVLICDSNTNTIRIYAP